MKCRKKFLWNTILAAVLALLLAACAAKETVSISGESLDVNDIALRPDGEAAQIYENSAMKLLVPLEYDDLLIVDMARDDALFSVSEKASIEAARAQGEEYDGAGWLFSIGRISAEKLHEMLCYDMSGAEVFAKDTDGGYYMYYHPTDVRLVRESYEDMEEDIRQWSALNEWAAGVPDSFLAENPGLTPEKHGNTELDMCLARIAYLDGTEYTISATSYGSVDGQRAEAKPYLDRLMNGVTFEIADEAETPDGEYIVLYFPEDDMRFDFFLMEGKENYIRQVWSDDFELLYQASFADGVTKAGAVMSEWYDSACSGEILETSGFTGEAFTERGI